MNLIDAQGSAMKVREIVRVIEGAGWKQVRVRGSHRQFRHTDRRGLVTIPGKDGEDVAVGTLDSILKQAGLKK